MIYTKAMELETSGRVRGHMCESGTGERERVGSESDSHYTGQRYTATPLHHYTG